MPVVMKGSCMCHEAIWIVIFSEVSLKQQKSLYYILSSLFQALLLAQLAVQLSSKMSVRYSSLSCVIPFGRLTGNLTLQIFYSPAPDTHSTPVQMWRD